MRRRPSQAEKSVIALNYVVAVDLFNGTTVTAATWTDITTDPNGTFNVLDANSLIEIAVRGAIDMGGTAGNISSRLNVDNGGQLLMFGGGYSPAGLYNNPLNGANPVFLTGLAAGSHTVRLQVYTPVTGDALLCRPATNPNYHHLEIVVIEYRGQA